MSRKPDTPPSDPQQSKRFIDMAREVEAAETREEAEKAFKKVVRSAQQPRTRPPS